MTASAARDLDDAVARIAGSALRPGPVGRVGLELENHLVDLADPGAPVDWHRLTRSAAGCGPLPGGSRITFEPGGQVELSAPPADDVAAAVLGLRADQATLGAALAADGLGLVLLGADPLRPARRLNGAARYAAMEAHFAAVGCADAGARMMTSTAALQVNLDAGPAADWSSRLALAHRLGPVLVAVSACSPLLAGRAVGWRSSRQQIWGELDSARCGPLLTGDDPAAEWAAYALAAPVMLVRDPVSGAAEPVRGRVPLADWVTGETRLGDRTATDADVDYHLTTLFPPVRPRGYLEIRYLDAAPEPWWPALAAVTATLLDDPVAADRAADACTPVADRWSDAARFGLADAALRTAAADCLAAAHDAAPPALRAEVGLLRELVSRGESPGDAVLRQAGSADPLAVLRAALDLPGGTP
ncbi:ergothioneine biosynthesis glutamate--cysteine ligase EgtA [Blastococcus sp. TBT05-19]|uniref:ergothioneine biosynthesis glutamate--cysteine ligase EgtA n=1 Tax=Blastococcus sp. TBT05-19 TaxID=2250581 RepID=UPI001F26D6EF|nr:ergothioneine biosynthesis glutamate--cysteine ligase EgtA [Blastococcus sp. TBT05-19]